MHIDHPVFACFHEPVNELLVKVSQQLRHQLGDTETYGLIPFVLYYIAANFVNEFYLHSFLRFKLNHYQSFQVFFIGVVISDEVLAIEFRLLEFEEGFLFLKQHQPIK